MPTRAHQPTPIGPRRSPCRRQNSVVPPQACVRTGDLWFREMRAKTFEPSGAGAEAVGLVDDDSASRHRPFGARHPASPRLPQPLSRQVNAGTAMALKTVEKAAIPYGLGCALDRGAECSVRILSEVMGRIQGSKPLRALPCCDPVSPAPGQKNSKSLKLLALPTGVEPVFSD